MRWQNQKELLEIPGVANASIDFESGRNLNAAEVEFDPKSVTPESLADVVNGIADKLYAVASVQVTHFAKKPLHSRLKSLRRLTRVAMAMTFRMLAGSVVRMTGSAAARLAQVFWPDDSAH